MPIFDSLEEFQEALSLYKNRELESYKEVAEKYGTSKSAVSGWFKPVLDEEESSKEVFERKTENVHNVADLEVGNEFKNKVRENDKTTIIVMWVIVLIVLLFLWWF